MAVVPAGLRVYAIGDLHGRSDLLDIMLERIAGDMAGEAGVRPMLVFLGDYVDRGPDSAGVLTRLAAGPPETGPLRGAGWITVLGNHDAHLLDFLIGAEAGEASPLDLDWALNGGMATIRSYLGPAADDDRHGDDAGLGRRLSAALPMAHRQLLETAPLWHRVGDYLFVHAGVRPGVPWDRQDPDDLLWIRHDFLSWTGPFDSRPGAPEVVVHGHTVVPAPDMRANRIAIDTGAWRTGCLSALVLEGMARRFLTARID